MIKIRRLNMDTSWQISWNETSLLLDPWLIGSEIDGFSWFNEQWHATPPFPINKLDHYDGIIISQSYNDHCHTETITRLESKPLICTPSARKKLQKELPNATIVDLPDFLDEELLRFNNVQIGYLDPNRNIDPIYYGIVMISGNRAVVYAPHGFSLTREQLSRLADYQVDLLITSFSLFKLPFFLGGAVNPGLVGAKELISKLSPIKVVHTHDENKHARGIVKMIAKVKYYEPDALLNEFENQFVYLDESYQEFAVSS